MTVNISVVVSHERHGIKMSEGVGQTTGGTYVSLFVKSYSVEFPLSSNQVSHCVLFSTSSLHFETIVTSISPTVMFEVFGGIVHWISAQHISKCSMRCEKCLERDQTVNCAASKPVPSTISHQTSARISDITFAKHIIEDLANCTPIQCASFSMKPGNKRME